MRVASFWGWPSAIERTMRPIIVGLDVDGLLLDIHSPWLAKYNRLSGDHLRVEDITDWDITRFVRPGWEGLIEGLRTPDLYDLCRPVAGARQGVEALLDRGYRLVVITHDYPSHLGTKVAALGEFFPSLRRIVFAKEKWATVPGIDLLIDDGAHNRPSILLNQPWNLRAKLGPGQVRANAWGDIPHLVEAIAVRKRLGRAA
jgi:5'(3')-deoxyribonucleotidase